MSVVSRGVVAVAVIATVAVTPAMAETVVTSPSGLFTNPTASSTSGPGVAFDKWYANNVRNNGAVGITGTYQHNGNGSIEFKSPQAGSSSSKADFEYYFSAPNRFLLSDLTTFSYDYYRDGASDAAAKYHPALRLYVSDGAGHTGYLVYEGIYNGQATAPVNNWTHADIIGGPGLDAKIWGTGSLPGAFNDYSKTAADWASLLPGLSVVGLSTGVGSGWDGAFSGAVDNISFQVRGRPAATAFNFEASATGDVPEPATWAMMLVGFGGVGFAMRRRSSTATRIRFS